ncbi:leptin b isoform X2 [Sparus aurata]|nr:leptin-B-like isoform X2 [Sparus aurata]
MQILSVILFVSLVVAHSCSSLPKRDDSIRNTIRSITNIAQTTLVHIRILRAKLPVAPQIEFSAPSINGLTNISYDLALLDQELKSPESLNQIQADVSSLEGLVRSLAVTMNCPVNDRPTGEVSNSLFPDTHLYLTLAKVQGYLDKFLLNKDKLKVC